MKENDRYSKAIQINLIAVACALWEWEILESFDNYLKKKKFFLYGASYFEISLKAIYCDMIRNSINVLEIAQKDDVASFWYILKTKKTMVEALKSYSEEKNNLLRDLSKKIKSIRDKDFFHFDKNGILDTKKIWLEAAISGDRLGEGLQYLFCILSELFQEVFHKEVPFSPDDYKEGEFVKLLDLAIENHLIILDYNVDKKDNE